MKNTIIKQLSSFSNAKWHHDAYTYTLYLSYFILFITFTGVISFSPEYLYIIQLIIRYYIIFILLVRFNPFIKAKFTDFDRKIAFSAGVFLFISSSLFDYIDNFLHIRTSLSTTSLSSTNDKPRITMPK